MKIEQFNHTYLTTNEVAELLRVTPRTVYSWLTSGKLKAVRASGRWRITEQDVKNFLSGGPEPASAASPVPSAVSPAVPPPLTPLQQHKLDRANKRKR